MGIEKRTGDLLHKLIQVGTDEPSYMGTEPRHLELDGGWSRAGSVHHEALVRYPGQPDTWIYLTPDQGRTFHRCQEALIEERELEHLTRRDIEDALWAFYCKLAVNRERLRKRPGEARALRDDLLAKLVKPHEEYEVMFPVESLEIGVGQIEILVPITGRGGGCTMRVQFLHFAEESAPSWGITPEVRQSTLTESASRMVGRTVGIVTVAAGSRDRAEERAMRAFDTALNILKAGVAWPQYVSLNDQEFLQRRALQSLVKRSGAPGSVVHTGRSPRRPHNLALGDYGQASVAGLVTRLQPLAERSGARDLWGRFVRALDWVGSAFAREDYDDKVVDLCTALETILTSRADRLKGEPLALRTMLLVGKTRYGYHSVNPSRVLQLYERRSTIVHGSDRWVCTREDYLELRRWTLDAITAGLALFASDPSIAKLGQFTAAIEKPDLIEAVVGEL